jgi:hypothetical protein
MTGSLPTTFAQAPILTSVSTFLAELDEFESSERVPGKRNVFTMTPDVDHNNDGWCWVVRSSGAKMTFGCTMANCEKRQKEGLVLKFAFEVVLPN